MVGRGLDVNSSLCIKINKKKGRGVMIKMVKLGILGIAIILTLTRLPEARLKK